MRGAHTEDRVWGQEVPRQRHRLTGLSGTGVLHAPDCIKGSSDAQTWPWAWLFEVPGGERPTFQGHESSSAGVEAGTTPREEGRPGPEARWGGSSGPSVSRPLAAALRPTCLPGAPSLFSLDSALPRPWLGKDRRTEGSLLRISGPVWNR